jgi:hypothetical protein
MSRKLSLCSVRPCDGTIDQVAAKAIKKFSTK